MNFNNRINDLCAKPYLFGVTSSENIFWYTVGYCVAENKKGEQEIIAKIAGFGEYIRSKYKIGFDAFNWGILVRYLDGSGCDSISLFQENYDEYLKSNKSYSSASFLSLLKKISAGGFYLNLRELGNIADNLMDVDIFILGYAAGCYDFGVNDNEYISFSKAKQEIYESILTEFDLPLYINCVQAIHSRYYPKNKAAIVFLWRK